MLTVTDVSLQFSTGTLYKHVDLKFAPGNCYGIIGANGAGKSTFLRILSGELEPTTGSVSLGPDDRMSVLEQDHFRYENDAVMDVVLRGSPRLYAIMKEKDELYAKPDFSEADGERAAVKCYGANDVLEGVAIMKKEKVDVSITGNSTNPTRFQHPVAGTYKKECVEKGKKYFSVASGGGTGRTLHPDNMAAGPASYGMTDTMGRMHSDAQFAGSSSVPAHVEMMGLIGAGNNPMVGMTVSVAVAIEEAAKAGKF